MPFLWKYLIALSWLAAFFLFSAGYLQAYEPIEFYIYWSAEPLEHLPDGQVRQVLTLNTSRPNVDLEDIENYIRLTKLRHYRQGGGEQGSRLIKKEWISTEDGRLQLNITAGDFERVDVLAKAYFNGGQYYAQTSFTLFSQAKQPSDQGVILSTQPVWPGFKLESSGDLYWPQTGQEFTLTPIGFKETPSIMMVWDYGKKVAELRKSKCFTYRPEHDTLLNNGGITTGKELVFTAAHDLIGSASFSLFIHRSRTAGADLAKGLNLLAASLLITSLVVYLARRRFKI